MKNTLLVFILCLFVQTSFAQKHCSTAVPDENVMVTLPWYGNPSYLVNLRDSVQNARGSQVPFQQGQGILPTEVGGVTETFFQVAMP